jgi:hypothetical protein
MKCLLVRVGADLTDDSRWNGPVDEKSGNFVYVPICETKPLRPGLERKYDELILPLTVFGVELPQHLVGRQMHLDPDFEHLTYGDQGRRAQQINELGENDLLVFYASLRDVNARHLVYAIIGLFVISEIVPAGSVPSSRWAENAHTRRIPGQTDIVVVAEPKVSGRLTRCIPIGEYRDGAYRVREDLLTEWGGLLVKDGYLQRSARLPAFVDCQQFYRWISRTTRLMQRNN